VVHKVKGSGINKVWCRLDFGEAMAKGFTLHHKTSWTLTHYFCLDRIQRANTGSILVKLVIEGFIEGKEHTI
jgi:hypothetical protein